ncbi:MAG: hypothetical protein ABSD85_04095 [Acidimicrobiales bacterium]
MWDWPQLLLGPLVIAAKLVPPGRAVDLRPRARLAAAAEREKLAYSMHATPAHLAETPKRPAGGPEESPGAPRPR